MILITVHYYALGFAIRLALHCIDAVSVALPGATDEFFRRARLFVDKRCRGEGDGDGRVIAAGSDGAAQDTVDGCPVRRPALRSADRDEIPSTD